VQYDHSKIAVSGSTVGIQKIKSSGSDTLKIWLVFILLRNISLSADFIYSYIVYKRKMHYFDLGRLQQTDNSFIKLLLSKGKFRRS